jgi:hypothetical protein
VWGIITFGIWRKFLVSVRIICKIIRFSVAKFRLHHVRSTKCYNGPLRKRGLQLTEGVRNFLLKRWLFFIVHRIFLIRLCLFLRSLLCVISWPNGVANVGPATQVRASAVLWFLIVGNWKAWLWIIFQWRIFAPLWGRGGWGAASSKIRHCVERTRALAA